MITEGNYIAKPKAMKFIKTDKESEAVEVAFLVEDEYLIWRGWLMKEGKPAESQDKSLSTVALLGFNGECEMTRDGKFSHPNVLDWETEVSVKVVYGTYTDQKTGEVKPNKFPSVAFVNPIGGSNFKGIKPEQIKSSVGMSLLKSMFKVKNHAPQQPVQPSFEQEKMPF